MFYTIFFGFNFTSFHFQYLVVSRKGWPAEKLSEIFGSCLEPFLRASIPMPRPKGGSGNVSPRQSTGSVNTHRVGSTSRTSTPTPSPQRTQPQPSRTQPTPQRTTNNNRGSSPWTGILLGSMLANMSQRNARKTYTQYPPNQYPPNQYPPNQYPPNQYPPNGYPQNQYPQQKRRSSGAATVILVIVFMFLLLMIMGLFGCSSSQEPTNDYNREKFNNPIAYNADCIVDELGFFVDPEETGERLKTFYDLTGVQPYIVISETVPGVYTDAQLEQYAKNYYKNNIDNQNTFLYMYMGDSNFSEDDAPGDMVVYRGNNIKSVMDDAAVNIFWDYMDQEWRSDLETDDLFVKVYDQTAKRIMTKSTTTKDIWLWVVIIAGVVILCLLGLYYVKLKHKREKEKAAETKAILETPLATDDPNDDDLLKRYGG